MEVEAIWHTEVLGLVQTWEPRMVMYSGTLSCNLVWQNHIWSFLIEASSLESNSYSLKLPTAGSIIPMRKIWSEVCHSREWVQFHNTCATCINIFLVRWEGFITHECLRNFGFLNFILFYFCFYFCFCAKSKEHCLSLWRDYPRRYYHSGCSKNTEPQ